MTSQTAQKATDLASSPGVSFSGLVALDAKGEADERTHLWLRTEDVIIPWLNELKALHSDLETQLATRTAEAREYEQQCFGRGPEGKNDWFHFQAEWLTWRARLIRFKQSVVITLREARQAVGGHARLPQSHHPSGERTTRQIILDVEERLGRLESLLLEDR